MSSFLCLVCHSTVNADTNEETREKYREVIGMNLCPDSHLCYICCYFLNKMWLFKSICLKRSLEYPVLFSEKGTINLQRSDTSVSILCPEDICLQHLNTRYHFYNNDENSQSDFDDNNYCELQDDRNFDINDTLLKTAPLENFRNEDYLFVTKDNVDDNLFNEELILPNLEPVRITQNDLVNGEWTQNIPKDGNNRNSMLLELHNSKSDGIEVLVMPVDNNEPLVMDNHLPIVMGMGKDVPIECAVTQNLQEVITGLSYAGNSFEQVDNCVNENIENNLFGNQSTLNSNIDRTTHNVANVGQTLANINDNVTNIYDNVTSINDIVTNINENVSNINDNLTNMNDNVTNIDDNVTNINDNLVNINVNISNVNDINENITSVDENVNENVTNINDNVTNINENLVNINVNMSNVNDINENITSVDENVPNINDSVNETIPNDNFIKEESSSEANNSSDIDDNEPTEVKSKKKKSKKELYEKLILTSEEQKVELDKARKDEKYTAASYKCHSCAMYFHFKDTYQTHMMRHEESNGEHFCSVCSLRFANPAVLRTHTANHSVRYKCKLCADVVRARQRQTHARHCAGKRDSVNCHLCGRVFQSVQQYQQHLRRYHGTSLRRYLCNVCGKSYDTRPRLRTHIITHINRKFDCDLCSSTFSSPYTLNQHKKSKHITKEPEVHHCATCKLTYNSRKSLLAHMRNALAHKESVYKCGVCGRTCPSLGALEGHTAAVHTRSRHLACRLCHKRYSTSRALVRHMASHKEGKPVPLCHSCGATFKSTTILKRHLKNVCEKDTRKCQIIDEELLQVNFFE